MSPAEHQASLALVSSFTSLRGPPHARGDPLTRAPKRAAGRRIGAVRRPAERKYQEERPGLQPLTRGTWSSAGRLAAPIHPVIESTNSDRTRSRDPSEPQPHPARDAVARRQLEGGLVQGREVDVGVLRDEVVVAER